MTAIKPDVLALGPAFALLPKVLGEMERYFTVHHRHDYPTFLDDKLSQPIRALASEPHRGAGRVLLGLFRKQEIIALSGVGLHLVKLPAARERNLCDTNTHGRVAREVADLAIGMTHASMRQTLFADRFVREGRWK